MTIPIFLFTFNCAKLPQQDFNLLYEALPLECPKLLCFGFQELVPIIDSSIPRKVNERLFETNESLHDVLKDKYRDLNINTINIHHLGAIGVIIMTPFQSLIKKIDNSISSCGFFFSSLKGAVATRFTLIKDEEDDEEVEFTIVVAHLSANEGYVERRNKDSWRLLRSLEFKDGWSVIKPGSHVFFMGDLNYRVSLNGDELKTQMIESKVFKGFTEQDIEFNPTYKFNIGSEEYSSKRIASWCDRILYLKYSNDEIIGKYDKLKFKTSDHQPVYLLLNIPFKSPSNIINQHGYLIEGGEYLKPTYSSKIGNYLMILSDTGIALGLKGVSTNSGRVVLLLLFFTVLWMLKP